VQKGARELRCVTVYLPAGIDLRLFEGEDFRRAPNCCATRPPSVLVRRSGEVLGRRGWSEVTTE
jgi:hypothetical protein